MTEKRDVWVGISCKGLREDGGRKNPEMPSTAQNLTDNAKRFGKKGWERQQEVVQMHTQINMQTNNVEWNTKLKAQLLQTDNEERKRRRGFLRHAKERWDREYPDCASASMQN